MPHRRPVQKGSFGSHFDELVASFPPNEEQPPPRQPRRDPELQQKIDIHRLLFELAWQAEKEG